MKIKNIEKTSERIKKAVSEREKIVLYGDADLDGTSSVVILEESIKAIGGEIFYVYFPDRGKEGYGLNDKALDMISEKSAGEKVLLIVMDCGIANFKEAIRARELGMDLIIIDHHQPHDNLPDASIIVDPKQKEDNYPFKDLANTGIIFKLAEEIVEGDLGILRKGFVELAALATISDMMKQEDDNKDIIDEGLSVLESTERPGLKIFWEMNLFDDETPIRDVAQKIISVLGASDIVDHKTEAYLALTSRDDKEVREIIKNLAEKNRIKQEKVTEMVEDVTEKVLPEDPVIFRGSEEWIIPLLGSAASKIENALKKPVFLYKKGKETSRGAVRVPQGINAVNVMEKSSDILIAYGGHPPAAGFSIKNENLDEFEKRLKDHFKGL